MELCLLLAAIALKINTASIKPIKVNKVHWMKIPTRCPCQAALDNVFEKAEDLDTRM